MIGIVNYGVGNLSSVANMIRRAGGQAEIVSDADGILRSDKILLPGVGHFDHGMRQLNSSGLRDALDEFSLSLRRPVLGICLGAQILGKGSEEGGESGLGWIDMRCRRFPETPGFRVPHMGWASLAIKRESPLLAATEADSRYYFVHSYFMEVAEQSECVATAFHGVDFTCVVQRDRIFGTQFHPEKSLRHGLAVIKAFVQLEGPPGG
jgi:glutamine amidotransferase